MEKSIVSTRRMLRTQLTDFSEQGFLRSSSCMRIRAPSHEVAAWIPVRRERDGVSFYVHSGPVVEDLGKLC